MFLLASCGAAKLFPPRWRNFLPSVFTLPTFFSLSSPCEIENNCFSRGSFVCLMRIYTISPSQFLLVVIIFTEKSLPRSLSEYLCLTMNDHMLRDVAGAEVNMIANQLISQALMWPPHQTHSPISIATVTWWMNIPVVYFSYALLPSRLLYLLKNKTLCKHMYIIYSTEKCLFIWAGCERKRKIHARAMWKGIFQKRFSFSTFMLFRLCRRRRFGVTFPGRIK